MPIFALVIKTIKDMTHKEFEEKWGAMIDRNELSFNEHLDFVEDAFSIYENGGFKEFFQTPHEEGSEYNGLKFEVINRITDVFDDEDSNIKTLPMWRIRFENGDDFNAYPEEICKLEETL